MVARTNRGANARSAGCRQVGAQRGVAHEETGRADQVDLLVQALPELVGVRAAGDVVPVRRVEGPRARVIGAGARVAKRLVFRAGPLARARAVPPRVRKPTSHIVVLVTADVRNPPTRVTDSAV